MTKNIKIGLEVHIHLKTKQKLFCECKNPSVNDKENTIICPICTAQPGSKPMMPNLEALKSIIKLGIIFGSEITKETFFNRKHYTWPDMPSGYQRTCSGNSTIPNCVGGKIFKYWN